MTIDRKTPIGKAIDTAIDHVAHLGDGADNERPGVGSSRWHSC